MTVSDLPIVLVLVLPWATLALLSFARLTPWIRRSLPLTPIIALLLATAVPDGEFQWDGLLLGSSFGLDDTNRLFLVATAIAWLAAAILAIPFIRDTRRSSRFLTCFLLAMAGNIALVLSLDIVSFYTVFAVMSLSAYGLVNHDGSSRSIFAGRVYVTLAIVGELLLFTALLSIAGLTANLDFPLAFDARPPNWSIAFVILGFGIKAGLVPLHVSLPIAYSAAPHPAGVALAGAMLNAGLLGFVRWLPLGQFEMPVWGLLLAVVGIAGVLFGVLLGLLQREPRALLGYSSISQVGLMTLFLSAAFLAPERWPVIAPLMAVFVLHHALAKTAAFCMTNGGYPGHLSRTWHIAALALPALTLVGVPLTAGFLAKYVLKDALLQADGGVAGLVPWLTGASIGSAVLMARWVQLVILTRSEGLQEARGFWTAIPIIIISAALPWLPNAGSVDWEATTIWSATWPAIAALPLAMTLWRIHRSGWSAIVPCGDIAHPVARGMKYAASAGRRWSRAVAGKWRLGCGAVLQLQERWLEIGYRRFSTIINPLGREANIGVFLAVLALLTVLLIAS